ncbi:MAG: hypothetical protein U1E23_16010 [Reyranellaceae bacterium]
MTLLLALLLALVGGGVGFLAGAAVAAALAPMLGISSFEGAAGYFAVFVGGPIGGLIGLVVGPWLVLRRAGFRGLGAMLPRLLAAIGGVAGLAAAVVAAFWMLRPIVNANGPAPRLVFEIRLPPGAATKGAEVELQTSKNSMPADLQDTTREGDRPVMRGSVELYYRVWDRTLVLRLPDRTDVLFILSLGLTPERSAAFGAWRPADYLAGANDAQPRRPGPADRYEIRSRVQWAGDD